ncbi:MAG: hypothetical protein FJ087_19045, partial [Deltaproteobacteria bacterium]|nr:hypothetical protein [Deltaproteobacteria bacterium]
MARRVAVLAAVAAAGAAGASAWWALSPRPAPEGLPRCEPPGMRAGPSERFGPDTLSDKINGRADFYLDAGFVGLTCAVVASGTHRDLRFEACDYDMGSFRGAFSVYSRQVRPEADEQ